MTVGGNSEVVVIGARVENSGVMMTVSVVVDDGIVCGDVVTTGSSGLVIVIGGIEEGRVTGLKESSVVVISRGTSGVGRGGIVGGAVGG